MNYTQKEIEEMRKRLPFKAVVWDDNKPRMEEIIVLILNDRRCANDYGIWENFIEIKEPKYVPFTIDDFKEFAGKWISVAGGFEQVIECSKTGITTLNYTKTFKEAFESWKFADTGKPFGKQI